jgi:hypothetical protein
MKNGCFYVDHNRCFPAIIVSTICVYVNLLGDSFNDPIPLAIMMKAMGTECDQEIVQLVGSDDFYQVSSQIVPCSVHVTLTSLQLELAASLAEAANLDVFTQLQVRVVSLYRQFRLLAHPFAGFELHRKQNQTLERLRVNP